MFVVDGTVTDLPCKISTYLQVDRQEDLVSTVTGHCVQQHVELEVSHACAAVAMQQSSTKTTIVKVWTFRPESVV